MTLVMLMVMVTVMVTVTVMVSYLSSPSSLSRRSQPLSSSKLMMMDFEKHQQYQDCDSNLVSWWSPRLARSSGTEEASSSSTRSSSSLLVSPTKPFSTSTTLMNLNLPTLPSHSPSQVPEGCCKKR